jgi:hypothetical protein
MLQVSTSVLAAVSGVLLFGAVATVAVLAALLAPAARRTAVVVAIALAAWFGIAYAIAVAGPTSLPLFGLRVVVPLLLGGLALFALEPARRLLADPRMRPALIALQTYRALGVVFLVLLALNALPALFAVPAGVGDVLIGITALPVARSLRAGRTGLAVVWNLLGLLDMVVAVATGAASGTTALGVLPLVVVPTFIVPLSVLLHAASLRSLATAQPAAEALAA